MKRTFFFLALMMLTLMAHAQRIDKPLCWFDNSSGRFLDISDRGKMLMNALYIDALDNLWIHNGRDVYLWHPSGKLQGYGDFNGTISFGFE